MSAPHNTAARSPAEVRTRLGARLVERKTLKPQALNDLKQRAVWRNVPLEQLLVQEGVIEENNLLIELSNLTDIPMLQAKTWDINETVVATVPPRAVVHYRIIPLSLDGGILTLATDHLREVDEEAQLRVILGHAIRWAFCSRREIDELTVHYYGVGIESFLNIQESEQGARTKHDDQHDFPALVDDIIRVAIRGNATDIHVEPDGDELRVRYRIDGVLYPAPLPRGLERYQRALISTIKVMAQLNIAERRLPQDGRMEKALDGQVFDIRVSALPTHHGEAVQMRLLNRQATFLQIEDLGLPQEQRKALSDLSHRPYGLILFTGPTGSGKTTSLYAALDELNDQKRKIITIEDPVEYEIKGITQLQVQPAIGFTFAQGLRSVLRHDPDVILVGEIRDDETADIAVSSALTGHLVLSTLHTNDSASAATRLIDMGIEPYLVASSVQGIVAQRLVRRICAQCREEVELDEQLRPEARRWIPDRTDPIMVFRGRGCPNCRFTGYQGRRAIYEVLELDDTLRNMIVERATATAILKRAMDRGLIPLRQAGWELALRGETSVEDVLRVTSRIRQKESGSGD